MNIIEFDIINSWVSRKLIDKSCSSTVAVLFAVFFLVIFQSTGQCRGIFLLYILFCLFKLSAILDNAEPKLVLTVDISVKIHVLVQVLCTESGSVRIHILYFTGDET